MCHRKNVRMAAGVVTALLAVTLGSAASQARTAGFVDPESATHAHSARAVPAAIPSSIDSDIYVSTVSPSSWAYFVVAGRLRLALKPGSMTMYTGTLIDYSGRKAYPAMANTANPARPILRVDGRNGAFRFRLDSSFGSSFYSGTATNAPVTLGVAPGKVALSAASHTSHSASFDFVLSERIGPVHALPEYTGSMTLVYDANNRIAGGSVTVEDSQGRQVTHAISGSGYYSSSYFYVIAQVDKYSFALNATSTGTSISGYGTNGVSTALSEWLLTGTAT